MKKRLLILATAMLTSVGAFAMGPVEFGIKAGINTGNFNLSKKNFSESILLINDARTGFNAGAFMRLNFLGLHVQPEFIYNWNRYNMEVIHKGENSSESTTKVRHQTLEVPVLVGLDILFLRVGAGPVFNIMNRTSTMSGAQADVDLLKPSVSYTIGAGLDIMKISLDIRYNGQFKKSTQNITIGGDHQSMKGNFSGWTFSLGYTF